MTVDVARSILTGRYITRARRRNIHGRFRTERGLLQGPNKAPRWVFSPCPQCAVRGVCVAGRPWSEERQTCPPSNSSATTNAPSSQHRRHRRSASSVANRGVTTESRLTRRRRSRCKESSGEHLPDGYVSAPSGIRGGAVTWLIADHVTATGCNGRSMCFVHGMLATGRIGPGTVRVPLMREPLLEPDASSCEHSSRGSVASRSEGCCLVRQGSSCTSRGRERLDGLGD